MDGLNNVVCMHEEGTIVRDRTSEWQNGRFILFYGSYNNACCIAITKKKKKKKMERVVSTLCVKRRRLHEKENLFIMLIWKRSRK